jgi:hypothetical protein
MIHGAYVQAVLLKRPGMPKSPTFEPRYRCNASPALSLSSKMEAYSETLPFCYGSFIPSLPLLAAELSFVRCLHHLFSVGRDWAFAGYWFKLHEDSITQEPLTRVILYTLELVYFFDTHCYIPHFSRFCVISLDTTAFRFGRTRFELLFRYHPASEFRLTLLIPALPAAFLAYQKVK